MKVVASAPGKLVLLGEYAVLEGAPALVQALDARARVRLEIDSTPVCEVIAPQVVDAPVAFTRDSAGRPLWPDSATAASLKLVDQVLRGLAARGLKPTGGLRIELDTAAFFVDRTAHPFHGLPQAGRGTIAGMQISSPEGKSIKLGLGSSAALTVALASALAAAGGAGERMVDRTAWLGELLGLHRAFQGGRGSGADLAAALYGGVLRYRLGAADQPQVLAATWPPGLRRLYVWTGRSASTGDYLTRLANWRQQRPRAYRERFAALRRIAEAGDAAIVAGDAVGLREAYRDYAVALQKLGEAATIPIYSAEHRRIEALVRAAGGVYKPCGAGGGDLGMAVLADLDRLPALRSDLAQAGFESPPLADDAVGLELATFGAS